MIIIDKKEKVLARSAFIMIKMGRNDEKLTHNGVQYDPLYIRLPCSLVPSSNPDMDC